MSPSPERDKSNHRRESKDPDRPRRRKHVINSKHHEIEPSRTKDTQPLEEEGVPPIESVAERRVGDDEDRDREQEYGQSDPDDAADPELAGQWRRLP